jgi:hypothetical protein
MPCSDRVVRDERGVALAVALFALVVIAGIVAGNFLAGLLEQQSGRNTLFVAQAAEAAEAGAREALLVPPAGTLVTLPIGGGPLDLGTASPIPGVQVVRSISRLTDTLFLVQAQGARHDADGNVLVRRAVGLLAALTIDSLTGLQVLRPIPQRAWLQLY